jgi:hypothetical protein
MTWLAGAAATRRQHGHGVTRGSFVAKVAPQLLDRAKSVNSKILDE